MKKFIIFFSTALVISIIFTGCGNWGGNNPVGVTGGSGQGYGENSDLLGTKSLLVGSWRHDYYNDYEIITFSSNGAWESKYYDDGYLEYHFTGTYSVSGNELTISVGGMSFITYTFSVNGDELTLVHPNYGSVTYYRV